MTAVEWLEKNISLDMSPLELIQCFDEAKKMENEQLFEFFKAGQDSMEEGGKSFHQIADNYLNK